MGENFFGQSDVAQEKQKSLTVVDNAPKKAEMTASCIPIGQVFRGTIGTSGHSGLFLRSYSVILSLDNPLHDWLVKSVPSLTIKNYEPVNATLTTR